MFLASLGAAAQSSAEPEEGGQLAIPPSSTLAPRLPHFYGHAADMQRVQAQLAASGTAAARLSLAAAPELQPIRSANVSVRALVQAFDTVVAAGYAHACVALVNEEQACLLDNFLAHLRKATAGGPSLPLLVVCADGPGLKACKRLSRAASAAPPSSSSSSSSSSSAGATPQLVLCVPMRGAGRAGAARRQPAGAPAARGLRRTQTSSYRDLVWLKPSLLWLGLELGLGGMLWSDLDVVLVHSPIEAFRWDRRQALMEWLCEHDQPNMANTGFGYVLGTPEAKEALTLTPTPTLTLTLTRYVLGTPETKEAVSRWAGMRGFKYSKQHRSYSKYNEQGALWLLNEQHTPRMQLYHCLPKETFLSGCNWKYQGWRLTERHYSALHFSCLDDKVARMRQLGLWIPTAPHCRHPGRADSVGSEQHGE